MKKTFFSLLYGLLSLTNKIGANLLINLSAQGSGRKEMFKGRVDPPIVFWVGTTTGRAKWFILIRCFKIISVKLFFFCYRLIFRNAQNILFNVIFTMNSKCKDIFLSLLEKEFFFSIFRTVIALTGFKTFCVIAFQGFSNFKHVDPSYVATIFKFFFSDVIYGFKCVHINRHTRCILIIILNSNWNWN